MTGAAIRLGHCAEPVHFPAYEDLPVVGQSLELPQRSANLVLLAGRQIMQPLQLRRDSLFVRRRQRLKILELLQNLLPGPF